MDGAGDRFGGGDQRSQRERVLAAFRSWGIDASATPDLSHLPPVTMDDFHQSFHRLCSSALDRFVVDAVMADLRRSAPFIPPKMVIRELFALGVAVLRREYGAYRSILLRARAEAERAARASLSLPPPEAPTPPAADQPPSPAPGTPLERAPSMTTPQEIMPPTTPTTPHSEAAPVTPPPPPPVRTPGAPPPAARSIPPGAPALSPRQLECLQCLDRGMQIKAIARLLDMSFHTVQRHLTHAYRKLGVTDGKQAIIRARELGLI